MESKHTNTVSQSGSGSNGNEGVLHPPPQSSRTRVLSSDGLGHSLERSYSAEMQSDYSTAPADWANLYFIADHTNGCFNRLYKFLFSF